MKDPKVLEGYQQFAYEHGCSAGRSWSYMYAMVPYVIEEEELVRVLDTMKAWFRR